MNTVAFDSFKLLQSLKSFETLESFESLEDFMLDRKVSSFTKNVFEYIQIYAIARVFLRIMQLSENSEVKAKLFRK